MKKFIDKKVMGKVRFERDNFLVDVILQDYITRENLFRGSMSKDTLEETIESGLVTLYSRSLKKKWLKGEGSGDLLRIVRIQLNCMDDTLNIEVKSLGEGVCHEHDENGKARASCFYKLLFEDKNEE
jgi:phosphoribosyl-AMP cyclohydrolase